MPSITINLPETEIGQHIEVEVKINGKRKCYNYRVEILYWETCEEPLEERVECIKRVVNSYDQDWELVQIGSPTDRNIAMMFKRRLESDAPVPTFDV